MDLLALVTQVRELLRQEGRLSYRLLKRQFSLDDETLEDLKFELIDIQELAADKEEKMLVWIGEDRLESSVPSRESTGATAGLSSRATEPPITYTPFHLAERIRAVTVVDGERKTITAVFADLKGSTALIEGLDPEEARAVIDPALQLMMDAVHQYEGFVAQALGDGIFALFGAPLAHEDHPQRALFAALRMQETMRRYADTLRQKGYPPLLMRVGVNTGEVVLRSIRKDDLHADYVPVGHSTNVAARMEQLAVPGTIVVSAYTQKLTDGYFAFKDLGPTQIKGVADALTIYELQGVGQLRTRLQVSASRSGLTRFVGRQSELAQLNQALAQTKAGHGQLVGTMGEPGLGKSRLFHEFKLLSLGGCLVLEAYSVSHGQATAYLPVMELLKTYSRIEQADDVRTRREKVLGKVLGLDRSLEDTLPYLFALLGIEEQPSPLAQMDPQIRRRRTFEALKKLFLRESLTQPLVLIFEDLHWIDNETQGFLDVLSESVASAKILLLTNYRPEYRHEWGQKTYYTQLRLAPLGKEEAEELLEVLLGESPRPAGERDRVRGSDNNLHALKHLILDKTQGTPFFLEEVVQALVEDGTLTGTPGHYQLAQRAATPHGLTLHIPPTVQGILAARIDRLASDEKALLQQLAVIGRQFPLSLIRHVVSQPEADLYRLLASLQHKEFLYEQPALPESDYLFKHALTQDVAYSSVLIERRKVLHEQTAQAIEQLYHDKLDEQYDELAHHYQRSGNVDKAVHYLHKAGQRAVLRSANVEAIIHLNAALALLNSLPQTSERDQQELALLITLGPVLTAVKGWTAPEVERTYTRAQELCRQIGETPQLFPVLVGLAGFYGLRSKLDMAQQLANQCFNLAQQDSRPDLLLEAHHVLGYTLFALGELVDSQAHLERGFTYYDFRKYQSQPELYVQGHDPGICCSANGAYALGVLGYPDQAVRKMKSAITLARDLSHPLSLAVALFWSALLYQFRREPFEAQKSIDGLQATSREHGFPSSFTIGMILQGGELAKHGQQEEGIAQMCQALADQRDMGTEQWRPYSLALLGEAYGDAGQLEKGLNVLAEALELVRTTGERSYEAELYRLKGELLLKQAEKLKA